MGRHRDAGLRVTTYAGRITHAIDVVGPKPTRTGTESVSGEVRIDVDDERLAEQILRLYLAADTAAFALLEARGRPVPRQADHHRWGDGGEM